MRSDSLSHGDLTMTAVHEWTGSRAAIKRMVWAGISCLVLAAIVSGRPIISANAVIDKKYNHPLPGGGACT